MHVFRSKKIIWTNREKEMLHHFEWVEGTIPKGRVEEVLTEKGEDFDDTTAEKIYNKIKSCTHYLKE